jgi:hypothetical protein
MPPEVKEEIRKAIRTLDAVHTFGILSTFLRIEGKRY